MNLQSKHPHKSPVSDIEKKRSGQKLHKIYVFVFIGDRNIYKYLCRPWELSALIIYRLRVRRVCCLTGRLEMKLKLTTLPGPRSMNYWLKHGLRQLKAIRTFKQIGPKGQKEGGESQIEVGDSLQWWRRLRFTYRRCCCHGPCLIYNQIKKRPKQVNKSQAYRAQGNSDYWTLKLPQAWIMCGQLKQKRGSKGDAACCCLSLNFKEMKVNKREDSLSESCPNRIVKW